ncbi:hypothetical protein HDU76_002307 [Blyttiomyces sp. JEL0837]|nr:hypothetical protein HDU76_002307 [Blyttiomyces sp. JEL0837]
MAAITKQPGTSPVMQKSYAHEVSVTSHTGSVIYTNCVQCCGNVFGCIGMLPCCGCCNPYKSVPQGNVGLVTRFGQYYKTVDPGLWQINIFSEAVHLVDIKVQIETIPEQAVMTKDNVQVSIDSVIFWEIVEPFTARFLVADVRKALIERTQTTLRHIFGTRTLQDCIGKNRETIAHEIQDIIAGPASTWGVKIESILIKDLKFSQELQETLSAAAKQKRIGESKVIIAQAEVAAAKLMREASDILNTQAAMQIRYLETLTQMAKNGGTKVIFMPTGMAVNGSGGSGDGGVVNASAQGDREFKVGMADVTAATVMEHVGKM